MHLLLTLYQTAHTRLTARRGEQDGVGELSTSLGIAAVSIVALVAIGAAVQALGIDVVNWARTQLISG